MNSEPLVSIIIPTFNRAHLIGETLDSVLAQTYTNWECIIVDDGSTDDTDIVVNAYVNKDPRFKYYHRPPEHLPGGNGARNYGFKVSKGEFIQWFDSDDVMSSNKLDLKVKIIKRFKVDFVISKTTYIGNEILDQYIYDYNEHDVNFLSYSTSHISWFTPDLFLKRAIAENIEFNEQIMAGQEYNFSCKLLLHTNQMKKIDEYLTYRRNSDNSIGNNRRKNKERYLVTRFDAYWLNYLDIIQFTSSHKFETFSLANCISCYLRSKEEFELPKQFHKELYRVFGLKSVYFFLAKWSQRLFNRYYFFYKKLIKIEMPLKN